MCQTVVKNQDILTNEVPKMSKTRVYDRRLPNAYLASVVFISSFGFFAAGSVVGWSTTVLYQIYAEMLNEFTCEKLALISSSLAFGAAMGPLLISLVCDKLGSRLSIALASFLIMCTVLFVFMLDGVILDFQTIVGINFVAGISVGILHFLVPLYVIEVTLDEFKQQFEYILYVQFAMGTFLQYIAGLHESAIINFALPVISSLIVFIGFIVLPESPNFLCREGKYSRAKDVLRKLYEETNDIENQLNHRIVFVNASRDTRNVLNVKDVFGYGSVSFFVPLYILAAFQQLMGGFPLFFYIVKIFKIVESDYSPEIISISSSGILIASILLFIVFNPDLRDKSFLQLITLLMFGCFVGLGSYCHLQGASFQPTSHGYMPLLLVLLLTVLYAIGPLRVSINYLQAMTNDINIFIGRLIYSTVTWIAVFMSTGVLPMLVETVGAGWIFWYMGILSLICYFFVKYFLPDLDNTVIDVCVLENEKNFSSDESLDKS